MGTRINVNNKLKKALSRFHVKALHISNDMLTMLNYNKKYVIKKINRDKLASPNTKINYDKFEDLEVREAIRNFVSTVSKHFTTEELTLLYRNLSSLTVERTKDEDRYNILTNTIKISKISNIYHELFHLATAIYTKDSEICGFQQYNKTLDDGIGNGLNEGYTELLAERYFGRDDVHNDSYRYEMIVARALEYIIGKDKMKSFYINADLTGLIPELQQITSNKEIFCILNRLDFICNNRYKDKLSYFRQNKVMEYIVYINSFLIMAYVDKLDIYNTPKAEIDDNTSRFFNLFNASFALNDRICNLDTLMQYMMSKHDKDKMIKRIYK